VAGVLENTTKRVRDQQQKEKEAEAKRNQQRLKNALEERRLASTEGYNQQLGVESAARVQQMDAETARRNRLDMQTDQTKFMEAQERKNQNNTMIDTILENRGQKDNKTARVDLLTLAERNPDAFNEMYQNALVDRRPMEAFLTQRGLDPETLREMPLSTLQQVYEKASKNAVESKDTNLFGDSVRSRAAQYMINEGLATEAEMAEQLLKDQRVSPQVITIPVDSNDPSKGTQQVVLDPNMNMEPIPGSKTTPPKKEINPADARLYNNYQSTLDQIDQSLGLLEDEDARDGVGPIQGSSFYPSFLVSPKGIEFRALLADLTSSRLNEKFGAALTKQEFERISPSIPLESDREEVLQVKLNTLKNFFTKKLGLLRQQYPPSRYQPFPDINAVGLDGYDEALEN